MVFQFFFVRVYDAAKDLQTCFCMTWHKLDLPLIRREQYASGVANLLSLTADIIKLQRIWALWILV